VKLMPRTAGFDTSSSPTSATLSREHVTTLKTPFGTPASSMISARMSPPATGVSSDGFRTTALPTASATANPRDDRITGKFHGEITATTPSGSRTTRLSLLRSDGRISPVTWYAAAAAARYTPAL